jgi:bacillithiol system protein YtxJ
MSLFKSLFGNESQPQDSNVDWKMLTSVAQLAHVIEESKHKPVLIFKHSTRCGISRMTLKRFENEFGLEDKVTPYFLDLLQHRDVSDAIAHQFNVVHQSPQMLLIKDGKCIYDTSHESIDANDLAEKL